LIDACAGDYKAALEKFAVDEPNYLPGASYYNRAAMYGLMGEPELEHAYYDSARTVLEKGVAAAPQDARYHSGLGIVYAGLGRREDAIREAELAAQLAPLSGDVMQNYFIAINLARTYAMVGEFDAAVDRLEELLSTPSLVSTASIRVNPFWIPLHGHPRFQRLLEGGK
jgi:tetratricopeptide (TPR) repeat protein